MEIIGYIASFLMGTTLGIMGGGGAILTVPILVYLFHFSPLLATSYSLFVVGVTALAGSLMYIRRGDINLKIAISFAVPSILGVNLARGIVLPQIPSLIFSFSGFNVTKEILMMLTFAVLMIAASFSMIKKRSEPKSIVHINFLKMVVLAVQGFFVGFIAGFVGAGGGFIIIPALIFFAGLSMRVAVGTSLLIIAFQSLLGFGGDVYRGFNPDWPFVILIAAVAVVGIVLGSLVAHKFNEQKLKKYFGWFVLLMGTTILAEQFRHF